MGRARLTPHARLFITAHSGSGSGKNMVAVRSARSSNVPAISGSRPQQRLVSHLDAMYIFMYMMWMAKSYSVADARSKLSEIVDAVEKGNDVEITRRGRKVAVVMSAARFARLRGDRIAFATAYESFLREHDLARIGVEPSWAAELRDRDPGRQVKL